MEFKEAMRAWERMCDAHNECEICPCVENCLRNLGFENIDASELEKTLEKWAAEHPEKTLMDDFFEKHPKALKRDHRSIPRSCAFDLGYVEHCASGGDCAECWRRPLEEV